MAKENDIDRLFREKLTDHTVQPSFLAWDKLEGRLSHKKKGPVLWMRIAAATVLMGGLTALIWVSVENTRQELDILADQEPVREYKVPENPTLPDTAPVEVEDAVEEESTSKAVAALPVVKKTTPTTVAPAPPTKAANEPEPVAKADIPVLELDDIEFPPMDQDLLMAENKLIDPEPTQDQEVVYKVTIISNGLREKPEKEGLVGEIENKIDKLGGLIGKVDQGFADLQDAKNNLFASITTRK